MEELPTIWLYQAQNAALTERTAAPGQSRPELVRTLIAKGLE